MEALRTYLNEVKSIALLTAKEEVQLSVRIKKGDEKARAQMIKANLRLVINIAKRYMHLGTPFLDLVEEGNLGLMRAVDKFDAKKGFRFSTYAAWWIKQGITRSLSEQGKMIRIPVYMNDLIAKWKKTKERLSQKLKAVPSEDEIAKKMKISERQREQVTSWLTTTTSSLEAPIGEEEESQVMDLIEDRTSKSPDLQVQQMLDRERITSLLDMMTPREKDVLDMRFGLQENKPHTLAEAALKLEISRERVRQIEEEALKKLRKFVKEQERG